MHLTVVCLPLSLVGKDVHAHGFGLLALLRINNLIRRRCYMSFVPCYLSLDSCFVWAASHLFRLMLILVVQFDSLSPGPPFQPRSHVAVLL